MNQRTACAVAMLGGVSVRALRKTGVDEEFPAGE